MGVGRAPGPNSSILSTYESSSWRVGSPWSNWSQGHIELWKGLSGISGMEYWNGILEWNTGMTLDPQFLNSVHVTCMIFDNDCL